MHLGIGVGAHLDDAGPAEAGLQLVLPVAYECRDMKARALKIPASGGWEFVEVGMEDGEVPLKFLQDAVGGWIECVGLFGAGMPELDIYLNEEFLGYKHAYVNRLRAQAGIQVKFDKHHELDFYLLGDHYKNKKIDTNREGSDSWKENGLVLKSITWYTGNMISAGIGYTWSF